MHWSNGKVLPLRICRSAIFRLRGDLPRIFVAVDSAQSAFARTASRFERSQNVLDARAREASVDEGPIGHDRPLGRPLRQKAASTASTGSVSHSASRRSASAPSARGEWRYRRPAIGGAQPLAGERTIGAELAGQPRQKKGRADIGKEADAHFRHGELKPVSRHPVRAVDGNSHAATHDDAVDQGDIGLAIMLDRSVERILVAPEFQRLRVAAGTPSS